MCQENYRKWQNEKGNGFCAVLYGAGDVYHDAASESCMGRDHTGVAASDRIPAVLLLAGTAVSVQTCSSIPLCCISLTGIRPIKQKKEIDYKLILHQSLFYSFAGSNYYARSTRPDLKQDVQTYIFLEPPSVFTLTDFTFVFHIFGDFL